MSEVNESNKQETAPIVSSKEKIDAILGITGGKSVDEFLDSLTLDIDTVNGAMSQINDTAKTAMDKLDSCQQAIIQQGAQPSILQINDMQLAQKELEDVIMLSKQVYKHVAESVLATDLIDAELVHATSAMFAEIRASLSEFMSFYKNKQNFIDKIKYAIFQQEQKKELMLLKHQLELEKMKQKNADDADDLDEIGGKSYVWDQDAVMKRFAEIDKKNMDKEGQ